MGGTPNDQIVGTDPEDGGSMLEAEWGSLGIPVSSPGRLYTAQICSDLVGGSWQTARQSLGTGSNLVLLATPSAGPTSAAYRVAAELP